MRQFAISFDDQPAASPSDPNAILAGLNPAQQEAAAALDGPVMIIAGPGSGKTRTLTHRIAYLLATKRAKPWEVLALTFTNKAAREMKARAVALVGEGAGRGLWMGTFHSTFARILRMEAEPIGFTKDFTIYDSDDSEKTLKELMGRYGIDAKKFKPRAVRGRLSGAKNQMVSPDDYARLAADPFEEAVAKLYRPYQEALRRANAMDFDDLLIWPIRLFENHPEVLAKYQAKWRYLHIDEYQDTNQAQYQLAKLLAAKHKNICVVGDDAQSIYAFRGADIQNILSFQKDYPDATVVRLEQNYRSTQRILKLADAIIKQNRDQLDKTLWTDNREGDPVRVTEALSERDEAQRIERTVRDLNARAGVLPRDVAVLYRTNAQSRSLEEALRRGGIPYRLVGGISFYQRAEIKDALAYLRLAVNPNDVASIRRVINTPTRGIGAKTMQRLEQYAATEGLTLWQAIERVHETGLSVRASNAISTFGFLVAHHAAKAETTPAHELAQSLLQESGLMTDLRNQNTPESLARLENVHELLNAIAEFADIPAARAEGAEETPPRTLSEFLQEVSLVTDLDSVSDDDNRVTLMTLHASKGLEFKVVFLVGLEEGLFPLAKAAQDPKELEEERRLFYVGVTRAEELLQLSYARSRYRYGESQGAVRSRFLDELDGLDDVLRTDTGRAFRPKKGRFELGGGGTGGYGEVDPHYYRRNLRGEKGAKKPRRTKRMPAAEPEPQGRRIVYDEGEGGELRPGMQVEHPKFGVGKVMGVEGRGDRASATVYFQRVGQKKLRLKFARLKVVGM
ncbi:MAG: UvrD-helicase domain-containing protein [Bacteroidota bacterium]